MERFCQNCDHQLGSSDNYCPACGQKAEDELSIKVLFNNTISNYFSVDARFFVSFLPLLFRPGYLPSRFVEGKRLTYLHPAQFYLFVSVIFFFLLSLESRKQQEAFDHSAGSKIKLNVDQKAMLETDSILQLLEEDTLWAGEEAALPPELDSSLMNARNNPVIQVGQAQSQLDSLIGAGAPLEEKIKVMGYREGSASWKKFFYTQALKIYENKGGQLLESFYDTIPVAMFFLLPVFGLLLKLFFWKKGKFALHLVFSFYFFTFLFILFSLLITINLFVNFSGWITFVILLSTFVYLVIGVQYFYRIKTGQAIFKSFMVTTLYLFLVIPTSAILLASVTFVLY